MQLFIAVLVGLLFGVACASDATAQAAGYGAAGPENVQLRAQPWLVPSGDAAVASHAILFRPEGSGPFRLAVIAHASTQNGLRRAQMREPEYKPLALDQTRCIGHRPHRDTYAAISRMARVTRRYRTWTTSPALTACMPSEALTSRQPAVSTPVARPVSTPPPGSSTRTSRPIVEQDPT